MKPDSTRCFVAVEIPNRIQAKLIEIQKTFCPKIDRASWTKEGNIHLTLKFLGEVNNSRIHDITISLNKAAMEYKPFSIEFGGIGIFPNLTRPRILWIGLKHGSKLVSKLADTINREMVKLGFPKDTRFHPHLTLARIKNRVNLNPIICLFKEFETLDGTSLTVNKISLVKSELHRKGAVYTPLTVCKLNKER